ncbi:MAG: hypothetical protein R3F34_01230 [Planctomycetota bacterium]
MLRGVREGPWKTILTLKSRYRPVGKYPGEELYDLANDLPREERNLFDDLGAQQQRVAAMAKKLDAHWKFESMGLRDGVQRTLADERSSCRPSATSPTMSEAEPSVERLDTIEALEGVRAEWSGPWSAAASTLFCNGPDRCSRTSARSPRTPSCSHGSRARRLGPADRPAPSSASRDAGDSRCAARSSWPTARSTRTTRTCRASEVASARGRRCS